MRPFERRSIPLLAATVILVSLAAAPAAHAGFYRWTQPAGGAWDNGSNWTPAGYPHFFFDFAMFETPGAYEIDATRAGLVPGVGGIVVSNSDVCLRAHAALAGAVTVGNQTTPASLTLRSGGVFASAVHTIGSKGTLVLEPGTKLESRVSGTVGFQINAGGILRGDGGSLERQTLRSFGTVSPGVAPGFTGVLYLGRTYPSGYVQRETGVLEIELGGPDPGSGYDRLEVVNGSAPVVLGGALRVSLLDGYIPDPSSTFAVLLAPAVSGTFATVELPVLPQREFTLEVTSNQVLIHVSGPSVIAAHLDVHPAGCPNSVGVNNQGVLPVALVGEDALRVEGVDRATLSLNGVAPVRASIEDVAAVFDGDACACSDAGPDGVDDLVLKFRAQEVLAALGSPSSGDAIPVTLTGTLLDGTPFEATDCIRLVGGGHSGAGRLSVYPASAPRELTQRVTTVLAASGPVTLGVYDLSGRRVAVLWSGDAPDGEQTWSWDASGLASGLYFYMLEGSIGSASAKVVILR